MKVLDAGCHDGFVGKFLRDQLNGSGQEVELYGMELYPEAIEKARQRGYVEVVADVAENAPEHFEAGFFDAVVGYELIEHVADPDALLSALERVLKPEGRIYLSTPDGTFGAGNNPHHLRVLPLHDLTDLVRVRGELKDAALGADGIATVSYTPGPRKEEITIFCGPGWERWEPIDIELKGLGGSETAAVRLAEALSEIGHTVTIYGECQSGMYRNVAHRHWSSFDPTDRRLALISSRQPHVFDRPVAADVRMLWLHDVDAGPHLTERRAESIDHVLTLSKWHANHVRGMYPFAAKKVRRVRNGIEHAYFNRDDMRDLERLQRVCYTSSPDRGLDVLLELWPRVLERVPGALLGHAYSSVYDRVAEADPKIAEHRERVRELSKQPGVHHFGSLSQPEVARLMRASLVWAHPSWVTTWRDATVETPRGDGVPFHETSCMGAMEAQAAGCLVVASGWGALLETVRVGRLINGEALSDEWRDAFVDNIVEGLTSEETQAWAQREAPKAARIFTWQHVAREVVKLIEAEVPA